MKIMTRRRPLGIIWFGGVGLADAILGMDGDQTVRRKVPDNPIPEEKVSNSDGEKWLDPDPEKQ